MESWHLLNQQLLLLQGRCSLQSCCEGSSRVPKDLLHPDLAVESQRAAIKPKKHQFTTCLMPVRLQCSLEFFPT